MKNSPSLKDIQLWIQSAMTSQSLTSPEAEALIETNSNGLSPAERIGVYAEGWFLRLEESLRDDYPRLAQKFVEMFGEEKWRELLNDYLRQCPSSNFNIAVAGDRLPGFLAEWEVQLKSTYLCDLAMLERAIYKIRGIPDFEIWNVAELQTLSMAEAETLRFELTNGVQLFEFDWNVDAVEWKDLPAEKVYRPVVVYRHDFSPTYQDLEPDQFLFLKRLEEKPLLTELVSELEGHNWMQWLAEFAADGIIRRV
jgi:hypothetical protein